MPAPEGLLRKRQLQDGDYTGTVITIASFLSLFVCLIPTTIGGLLSAIGIAGMDRALRANVITKSGKAVETAGDAGRGRRDWTPSSARSADRGSRCRGRRCSWPRAKRN